jgi:uncharacterized membrane protein YGL010W
MLTPFRPAVAVLQQYAEYHRDRRNIATHFVGVPMIVVALGVLLSRPSVTVGALTLTPAWVLYALTAIWYLTRGQFVLGAATSVGVGVLVALSHALAGAGIWLGGGLALFVVGWIVQFVGHYYEGRKPAFTDDLVGLLVAPMFVVLELLAQHGRFRELMQAIERHAGPTIVRDLAHPAA